MSPVRSEIWDVQSDEHSQLKELVYDLAFIFIDSSPFSKSPMGSFNPAKCSIVKMKSETVRRWTCQWLHSAYTLRTVVLTLQPGSPLLGTMIIPAQWEVQMHTVSDAKMCREFGPSQIHSLESYKY